MMETLYDLFKKVVISNAEKDAVIWYNIDDSIKATYREVLQESERVSECLKECGATGFVGICMEQNICFPALVLGILHNKMAFTCVDTHLSEEQLFSFLQTLKLCWVFTRTCNTKSVKVTDLLSKYGVLKIEINIHDNNIALWQLHIFKDFTTLKNKEMAYAIQTSGTTGTPKIVQVPHKCIVSNIIHLSSILKIEVDDIIFLGAPLTFDPSVVELFLALACGAALLVVPSEVRASPLLLLEALFPRKSDVRPGVTILQATPSVVSRWSLQELQERVLAADTTLKVLLLGGEPCPNAVTLMKWRGSGNQTQMFNVYGITEVSCWASIHPIEDYSQMVTATSAEGYLLQTPHGIPLGYPLAQTLLEVRDQLGYKVIHGEGEMFIGSMERICIINHEIEDNLLPPVFRATGDIVQVDSRKGQLLFMGRKDSMVKRWGHRVSLAQVDQVATSHSTVDKCCCIWDPSKACLGLAITTRANENSDSCVRSLRQFLGNHLPTGSLPDLIIIVETLPLTKHGKIDREKVRSLIFSTVKDMKLNVLNMPVSTVFAELWLKYLCTEPKPEDTFLQFGGNSFLALHFATELEETCGYRIGGTFISLLVMGSSFEECCHYLNSEQHDTLAFEAHNNLKSDYSNVINLEGAVQLPSVSKVATEMSALKKKKDPKWLEVSNHFIVQNEMTLVKTQNTTKSKRKFVISANEEDEQKIHIGMDNVNAIDSIENENHVKRVKCKDIEMITVDIRDMNKKCDVTNQRIYLPKGEEVCIVETLLSTSCRGQVKKFGVVEEQTNSEPLKLRSLSIGLAMDWKFNLKKCVDASPCYVKLLSGKNLVVIGSHSHHLAVLDGSTGTSLADCELPDRIESSACISPCGRFGVVGCYDGGVYCITLESGVVIWHYQTGGMVKSSPVLCLNGSAIIVGSYDNKLYCIRILDGTLVWCITPGSGSIFANPCLSDASSTVYIATLDGTCAAVCEQTGKIKWLTKFESPIFASPLLVHAAKAVLFAEVEGSVRCVSSDLGQKLWTFKAEGNIFSSFSTEVISRDTESYELYIFGCHDNSIYCLRWMQHCDNIALQWRLKVDAAVFSTPFVFPIMANMSESCVEKWRDELWTAVVTTKGTILLVDAIMGLVKCSFSLPHEVFSSPIVCDGRLVVGCRDNFVYSLNIIS